MLGELLLKQLVENGINQEELHTILSNKLAAKKMANSIKEIVETLRSMKERGLTSAEGEPNNLNVQLAYDMARQDLVEYYRRQRKLAM